MLAGNRIGVDSVVGGLASSQRVTLASDSNRILKLRAKGGNLPTDPFYAIGNDYAYSYGARGRVATLAKSGSTIASWTYDFTGRRVAASYPGSSPASIHYLYAPDGRLLAEHDGATGALLREYVWLDDVPLALVSGAVSTPVYHYVHTGQIGEPLMVTDASKAKVWDAAIDPWGKPVMLSTATVPLNLRLPGQWYQETARLHQNWMRDYDPVLGVYIEADPLGIEAGQNLYGDVGGNPLNAIDPMGLEGIGTWNSPENLRSQGKRDGARIDNWRRGPTPGCQYYVNACQASGNKSRYYCSTAPMMCKNPKISPFLWGVDDYKIDQIRVCLQREDGIAPKKRICNSQGCFDAPADATIDEYHQKCYKQCNVSLWRYPGVSPAGLPLGNER